MILFYIYMATRKQFC